MGTPPYAKSFKLTPNEAQSALWKRIEKEITKMRDDARVRNDAPLGADQTAKVRGEIAVCKTILDWADPNPEIN